MTRLKSIYFGGVATLTVAIAAGAHAQATPDKLSTTVGEVIVTAQHRTENLQKVPISAQVVSGQTLKTENHNTLEELTQTLPGVHIGGGGDFANLLYIRGIGSSGNPSFDQSVATFIDDVYFGRSRTSGATFLDLDRIEVLKGPQSTYFGNNAIAGALNIVTKKPGDTFEAEVRTLYGSYGEYAVEGEATLPVNDQLSVRFAGIFDGNGGWIKNVNTGKNAPESDNKAGRVTAVWRPTSNFDATFKIEGSANRIGGTDQGLPEQYADCPAPAPIGANAGGVFCAQALALHIPNGVSQDENSGLPGQMSFLSTFGSELTANYRFGDGLTLTSVTGYNQYAANSRGDQVGFPAFLNTHSTWENYDQISQELRVSSPTGQRLEYMAGVYVQSDYLKQDYELNVPFVDALFPLLGVPAQYEPLAWNPGFSQRETVYSAFGSASWNITDSLKLTGGLRALSGEKDFTGYNQYGTSDQLYGGFTPIPANYAAAFGIIEGPPGSISIKRTDQALMPSAKLQYQITPATMAYFSYSKGFKQGGFNGSQPFNSPNNLSYGPEHVDAYEVGIKSKFLDDRVLLDLDVFRSDYTDLQSTAAIFEPALNAYTTFVRNAAASRSQGVELESQWVVTGDFRLAANVTYLDSYYVSYPNASPTNLQTFTGSAQFDNLAGERTPYAPLWSGSVSARYVLHLPDGFRLTSELSPYFSSSYNMLEYPYVLGTQAYVRLDGKLTLEPARGNWAVDLIGKNLTNQQIISLASIYIIEKEEPLNVAIRPGSMVVARRVGEVSDPLHAMCLLLRQNASGAADFPG